MTNVSRRRLLLGSLAGAGSLGWVPQATRRQEEVRFPNRTAAQLYEGIKEAPLSDVHCHALQALTPLTERQFLTELSLPAFMLGAYFPPGVFEQWRTGDPETRRRLNETHGIERKMDELNRDFAQTVFVQFLVKEMSAFLGCRPTLRDVVAARNERCKDFWGYVNGLFAAVRFRTLLVDTGYGYNRINFKEFADRTKAEIFWVFRLESALNPLLNEDLSLDDLIARFLGRLRKELDDGHVGFKSYIASTGLDVHPWPRQDVEQAWADYKRTPQEQRQTRSRASKVVREHLLWHALDLAYERDVPVQIHCGNGEGPGVYLSHQYPYNLEDVVRYPVTFPQKPVKIVLVHGGYPHVDQAAYMSHIFPNAYFDISLMAPLVNRGLHDRFLNIFETAPMSKILHGSDAYNLPEFFYLSGKWTKRYLATALAVLVDEGIYTLDEGIKIAKDILYDNTVRAYNLDRRRRSA